MAPPSPFRRSVTGRVSVVAHRGLSATEPENTLRALRAAHAAGADLIEFDVHLSRDDVPVVIHDDTLERTTNGAGRVRDRTLDELRALDAGSGERVPTLDEVAAWAGASGAVLSVELKQPAPVGGAPRYDDIADRAIAILRTHGVLDRCLVHSFDVPTVRRVRRLAPAAATAVSYGGGTFADPLVIARSADASGIHPWWQWVSREVCDAAHEAGMHVHAWGMQDAAYATALPLLVRAGVDSLDSGDPAALRRLLRTTTM